MVTRRTVVFSITMWQRRMVFENRRRVGGGEYSLPPIENFIQVTNDIYHKKVTV